jgi:hypothetical protein
MVTSAKPRPHRRSLLRGRWRAPHSPGLMHRGASEAPFRHRHLLGIEGLSPDDINHVLDLADGYVELNRQAEKKHGLLRGGTIINLLLRELDAHPHLVRGSPAIGQPMRRIGLADPLNWIDDLRTKPGAPLSCPAAQPPAVEKHKEKVLGRNVQSGHWSSSAWSEEAERVLGPIYLARAGPQFIIPF